MLRPVILAVVLCLFHLPLFAQGVAPQLRQPQLRPIGNPDVFPEMKVAAASKACTINAISCGQTVMGQIDIFDCDLGTGFWVDFWTFSGKAGDTVTINSASSDFDTYLVLLDNTGVDPETVADDNDSGPGTNSRIVYTIDTSGSWGIGVANNLSFDVGTYTLTLQCAATPAPPTAPSNLTATALSSTEVQLNWNDNSNNEEEFRVESRLSGGGSYQDLGSVSAGSVGAIVSNLMPNTAYDFRVRARNSGGNSGYTNVASATTLAEGACQPSDTVLCLREGRFKIESGRTGVEGYLSGIIVLSDDGSAVMYYVNSTKWELIVNIQPRGDRFWLSASGLTEGREYDIMVTDVITDEVWTFKLPDSNPRVTNAPLSLR